MAGIQLVAERIGTSLDIPGPLQQFKFTESNSKVLLNNIYAPAAGGSSNIIQLESRNNYESGFRWIHETPNATPGTNAASGSYSLYRFLNNSATTQLLLTFDSQGNATFPNSVNIVGNSGTNWANLGTPTAPVDFGGQKLLNVGTGSAATDGVNLGQIQNLFNNLTLTSSKITDLATTVKAYTLNSFAAPTASLNLNSQKIINLLDPTAAQDGATKNYIDTKTWMTSQITDFSASVLAFRLDQFAVSTTSVNMNNQKFINLMDATDPQDGVNLRTLNSKISAITTTGAVTGTTNSSGVISTLLSATQPLGFTQLNFNWANSTNLGPGDQIPYVFQHLLSDNAPFYKAHSYVVKSAQVARYFSVDYILGDPTNPSPSYSIKFYHPLATPTTSTPLSLISNPSGSAAAWTMYLGATLDLQNQKILNCIDPTTAQGVATKNFVETFVNAKTWTTSQITNFSSSVTAFKLDQFAVPTAALNINSQNLNNISSLGILTAAVGSGRITFSNAVNSRKITLYDALGTNDNYNYSGFGASATDTIYNCPIGGTHSFYTGDNTSFAMQIIKTQLYLDSTSSTVDFRKVVLWQTVPGANNSHQCVAIGNSPKGSDSIMRFQVPSTNSDFVYYSGIDSANSYEVMRLTGTGRLGIGISPKAPLHFSYTPEPKIILYGSGDNTHQYFGFAIDPNAIRYQCFGGSSAHVFYSGTSSTTSSELARINAAGELIVQGTIYGRAPSGAMSMQGNATVTNIATAGAWAKVEGITIDSSLNQWTMPSSNRLTYVGTTSLTSLITVHLAASQNNGAVNEIKFALYKNGAQILTSVMATAMSPNTLTLVSLAAITPIVTNDYIEVYTSHPIGARTVLVKYLTVIATQT